MSSHRRTQPNKQVFLVCHYAWPICRNISSPCRDPREWQVTKSPFISFQANSSHQAHWEQKNPGHKGDPLLHRWAPPIIVEGLSDPLVLRIQLINSGKINKIWNQNQHMFGTAASFATCLLFPPSMKVHCVQVILVWLACEPCHMEPCWFKWADTDLATGSNRIAGMNQCEGYKTSSPEHSDISPIHHRFSNESFVTSTPLL